MIFHRQCFQINHSDRLARQGLNTSGISLINGVPIYVHACIISFLNTIPQGRMLAQ